MRSFSIVSALFLFIGLVQCQVQKVRFCVPQSKLSLCQKMEEDVNDLIECIPRIDGLSCLEAIAANEADTMNIDAANLFVAGKEFNLSIVAIEGINGEPYKYRSVALVPKSLQLSSLSDLKGKKSCHTGVGRTAGWQIPIAELQLKEVMATDCQGELETVENFFNESCAPGKWSSDPLVDAELKKKHPRLCALCGDPVTCARDDIYGGYIGALRCLADEKGDISFSKIDVVEKYVEENPNFAEKYEYLCLDNTRKGIRDAEPTTCTWGVRPSNAFITCSHKTDEQKEHIYSTLRQIHSLHPSSIPQVQNQQPPEWFYGYFVSSRDVSDLLQPSSEQQNPLSYLGNFRYTMDRNFGDCAPSTVRFCTTSEQGIQKCKDLGKMTHSRRIDFSVDCVLEATTADCITAVKEGRADIITLDGGDVYRAGRYSNLVPIASELYGQKDATYYAVAVISANSQISSLGDLRGLRSCHTGMGRTAGWVMPVGCLTKHGLISKTQCDKAAAVAEFFSASCAPGANDPKYNPSGSGADKLCQQCIGDDNGEHKCSRGSAERYSGYAGAFRCLASGDGDVAFVKHTTVPEYTDGSSQVDWAKDLSSNNYKLLCKNGTTSAVENYEECNIGRVPSHSVMTSETSAERRLKLAEFIASINNWFGVSSTNYILFKPYQGKTDLLFKDSTTALKAVALDADYKDVLGEDYLNAVESTDPTLCVQES